MSYGDTIDEKTKANNNKHRAPGVAYARVPTERQSTVNQLRELQNIAGNTADGVLAFFVLFPYRKAKQH